MDKQRWIPDEDVFCGQDMMRVMQRAQEAGAASPDMRCRDYIFTKTER